MFKTWKYVSCIYCDENLVKRAAKVKHYIEKHIGRRVECKLEMRIGDFGGGSVFDMYMRLNDNEAAFVRGLTNAEGFFMRATKD